jgi:hypothetical protein
MSETNTCKAFPEGIPLRSEDTHFEVLPGQEGETIYDLDMSQYDAFDIYRRIHPGVRFPLILTYDIPEPDENFERVDAELEEEDEE